MHNDFPNKPPAKPHGLDRLLVTPKSVEQHEACKNEVIGALARFHNFDPHDKEAAGRLGHHRRGAGLRAP